MISVPDRMNACSLIDEAIEACARQASACRELGLTARTFRRWKRDGGRRGWPAGCLPSRATEQADR